MLNLEYDNIFRWKRYPNSTIIVNNDTNCDFAHELQSLLQKEGKPIALIDAQTLYARNELKEKLASLQEGFLIIDHLTEVPDTAEQEEIQNILYCVLKGDWRNATNMNICFGSEWEDHLAQTPLQIYAVISNGVTKNRAIPMGACSWLAYGDNPDIQIRRIDKPL